MASSDLAVRLDKWLWAARFYRTRSLAKAAIESGHVRVDGDRSKVAREVRPGMLIQVRQGWDEKEVAVVALSDVRRGAPEAQALYAETEASLARRERERLARQAEPRPEPAGRPNKKMRRLIKRFKQDFLSDL
ncbi:RNA-binding protein [Flagellatimonas centrodinii]|uniref:RNA-binding S4 domain-containing protein n=1 Tax=Flagellatimonas centrodinii TaxID=2806210 RepID=UPI001FFAFFD1|nr:S4 domain-containing protein [Flagellatimonas centrodinii]ULQ46746.1 RNA-binding protein [Flagellatimonas centrodinii]